MFESLSTPVLLVLFAIAALVVTLVSIRVTALADTIADRTRLGEALVGGLVLGAATSLAGVVVSVNAALSGDASYAFSNGIGGIAAQTLFLAFADMIHRKANLEHAAAEPASLFQCALLLFLLSLPLLAASGPDVSIWSVHPVSLFMLVAYLWGMKLAYEVRENPQWRPVHTSDTRTDTPEDEDEPNRSATGPMLQFAALVAVLGLAGYVIAQSGGAFIARFGLSSSLVGALVTAVATSLPELVTTLAAVRRGALQLAVGGIVGGNTFDTLFLVLSDVSYRDGSLFHAIGGQDFFWLATGLAMTAVLLCGLILRERRGPGRIGLESLLLIAIYAAALATEITATAPSR